MDTLLNHRFGRGSFVLLLWVIWTVNGLLWTSQTLIAAGLEGRDLQPGSAATLQMGVAYLWALLTPVILWLGRRFPLDRRHWASSLFLHLILSVGLAFPLNVCKVLLARWAGRYQAMAAPLLDRSIVNFVSWFDMDVLLYWVILGVGHAIDHARREREREVRAAELQTQLAEARLASLESQLHPHFLFNALHTISALVRTDNRARAIQVVAGLGDLLRRALHRPASPEVPLKQELEFLERYLEIEKVRFGDRLMVCLEVDPEVIDARAPYLILQPLVENAIRHGIGKRAAPGRLTIRAARGAGRLELEVRDDGPGLPPGWDARGVTGVGLRNVRERLQQLYGARQSFVVANAASGGVSASISLPWALAAEEWEGER